MKDGRWDEDDFTFVKSVLGQISTLAEHWPGGTKALRQSVRFKTWIDELYELRSDYAHDGATSASGWTPFQHLLMAAFVFPLVVKKMLAGEGAYTLTDEDGARCRAIDKFLLASAWNGNDENTGWTRILRAERKRLSNSRIVEIVTELLAQHPDD